MQAISPDPLQQEVYRLMTESYMMNGCPCDNRVEGTEGYGTKYIRRTAPYRTVIAYRTTRTLRYVRKYRAHEWSTVPYRY